MHYLDTMAAFPNADHDDDVDSTTQALNWLIGRGDAMVPFRVLRGRGGKAQRQLRSGDNLRIAEGMDAPISSDDRE